MYIRNSSQTKHKDAERVLSVYQSLVVYPTHTKKPHRTALYLRLLICFAMIIMQQPCSQVLRRFLLSFQLFSLSASVSDFYAQRSHPVVIVKDLCQTMTKKSQMITLCGVEQKYTAQSQDLASMCHAILYNTSFVRSNTRRHEQSQTVINSREQSRARRRVRW